MIQIILRAALAIAFLAIGYWVSVSMFEDKVQTKKDKKAGHMGMHSAHAKAHKGNHKSGKKKKLSSTKKTSSSGANVKFKQLAQETTITTLSPVDFHVQLLTQGTVKARTDTKLNALVSGKIILIAENLQDGAFFKKGDLLLEIDPTDYNSQIITANASLARAESNLAQEEARAAQALRNWKDIGFDEEPNDLVLRKPQLKEARANVASQQAALDRANRNQERTKIYAPYDGRVRKRTVGPGESIGNNTSIAEIYATDYAEIRLPLSSRQLTQITINEQGNQAIPVTLTDAISDNTTTWNATIKYVEGELDETSRELFVIAHVQDPFGNKTGHPPLRMNQPVKAAISGNIIKDAYIIPRKHLYGANEILLVKDGLLVRKTIEIEWNTTAAVITTDTSLQGKLLATSRINYAKTGTPVNIIEQDKEAEPKVEIEPAAQHAKAAHTTSAL